jgi:hypothetical protein
LNRANQKPEEGLTVEQFAAAFANIPEAKPAAGNPPGVPLRGGLFQAFDTDHDGQLSSGEITAAPEVLKKLDKNGDGTLTGEELRAALLAGAAPQ